jgi:hypothetical protein
LLALIDFLLAPIRRLLPLALRGLLLLQRLRSLAAFLVLPSPLLTLALELGLRPPSILIPNRADQNLKLRARVCDYHGVMLRLTLLGTCRFSFRLRFALLRNGCVAFRIQARIHSWRRSGRCFRYSPTLALLRG